MTREELIAELVKERFGPLAVERTRPLPKALPTKEQVTAKRRRDLEVACSKRVPPMTYVEFRNNPAKAPWLSNQNRAEAGG